MLPSCKGNPSEMEVWEAKTPLLRAYAATVLSDKNEKDDSKEWEDCWERVADTSTYIKESKWW